MNNFVDTDYITIIIPSIGRETLKNSIQSLFDQTLNKWKVIIVYDGCKNILDLDLLNDKRISYYEIEKTNGVINQAGDVRNYGMQFVKSKWVGFLDDDDCLGQNYVEYFFKNCELFHFDIFIYRMIQEDLKIFPSLLSKDIIPCDVGISFIMNIDLFRKCELKFENSHCEDYDFLYLAKKKNHLILISHYIQYFIKSCENDYMDKEIELKNTFKDVVFINGINPNCFLHFCKNVKLLKTY
jgi:glycosyltransferase involved in cell wall biosynthesis